jgi:hypothetical protein
MLNSTNETRAVSVTAKLLGDKTISNARRKFSIDPYSTSYFVRWSIFFFLAFSIYGWAYHFEHHVAIDVS